MGCGRTGSRLAGLLSAAGHDVTVIDWSPDAFDRLPDDFGGDTVLGNAIDQDVLQRAGAGDAEVFIAATSGDNRNVMASEIARHVFHVPRVICRIKDPIRASIFNHDGVDVDCRTTHGADAVLRLIGLERAG